MTTVTVTMVNTTNEELLLDPVEFGHLLPPGLERRNAPNRVGPHASGEFVMRRGLSFLLGGDADRPIYVQVDGAVWSTPACVVRSNAGERGLEVQVSPAPWLHGNGRHGRKPSRTS